MMSSFLFDVAVEVVLSPFASAETEDVECLFDLVLVAARMLCSRDDRKRLNVLSWASGLTGGWETLDEVDTELSLGSGSRAMLKGLEIASCVRRCRTADVMYVEHPKDERLGKGGNYSVNVTTGRAGPISTEQEDQDRGLGCEV